MNNELSEFDVSSLEFELEKNKQAKQEGGYVNNKELQQEFIRYADTKKAWIEAGKEGHPPLTNKIGKAILDISNKRCYSRNFVGYSQDWKEEMIDDAIECCVKYVHNYDPYKYNNPFAYITQLVNNALINRIRIEKFELYKRHKTFDMLGGFAATEEFGEDEILATHVNETNDMYKDYLRQIDDFESKYLRKPSKDDTQQEESLGILEFLN